MASDPALTPPAPLENLTLWQRVYDHLRAEILAGRLQPGAELAEVALSEQLLGQLGRYRSRSVLLRGNLQRSVAEHAAILRAARRGDADRAAHLMSEHIRVPQRSLRALSDSELAPAETGS